MSIEYIFSINTGRSGSDYLSKLLDSIPDICSLHEPYPMMNSTVMYEYVRGQKDGMEKLMPDKIASIHKRKKDKSLYVETNHCFIKGFGWEIPKYIDQKKIGVIILERNTNKIVESYLRIGSNPFSNDGLNWLITPYKKALVNPPISARKYWIIRQILKPYFLFSKKTPIPIRTLSKKLLEWYVAETKALQQLYIEKHPDITFYQINLDQLNDLNEVKNLIAAFGLDANAASKHLTKMIGSVTNTKE